MRSAWVFVAIAGLAGCKSFSYLCASSAECTNAAGQTGTCESTGFCSFPDPSCDSGRRYGDYAGEPYPNACVAPGVNVDAAVVDAVDGKPIDAPPNAVTKTFGETGTADFTGVTFDAEITNQSMMGGNCCDHVSVDLNYEWGLIRWDVTGIPAGATIVSAEAEVSTADAVNVHSAGEVQVYRVLEAWDEVAMTYFMRTATATWTNQGARPPSSRGTAVLHHFAATMDARFTIPLPAAMVQAWVDNPSSDSNGIEIDTITGVGHLHIATKVHVQPARRPLLRVVYLPPM